MGLKLFDSRFARYTLFWILIHFYFSNVLHHNFTFLSILYLLSVWHVITLFSDKFQYFWIAYTKSVFWCVSQLFQLKAPLWAILGLGFFQCYIALQFFLKTIIAIEHEPNQRKTKKKVKKFQIAKQTLLERTQGIFNHLWRFSVSISFISGKHL